VITISRCSLLPCDDDARPMIAMRSSAWCSAVKHGRSVSKTCSWTANTRLGHQMALVLLARLWFQIRSPRGSSGRPLGRVEGPTRWPGGRGPGNAGQAVGRVDATDPVSVHLSRARNQLMVPDRREHRPRRPTAFRELGKKTVKPWLSWLNQAAICGSTEAIRTFNPVSGLRTLGSLKD
jgi:hypothetical protein